MTRSSLALRVHHATLGASSNTAGERLATESQGSLPTRQPPHNQQPRRPRAATRTTAARPARRSAARRRRGAAQRHPKTPCRRNAPREAGERQTISSEERLLSAATKRGALQKPSAPPPAHAALPEPPETLDSPKKASAPPLREVQLLARCGKKRERPFSEAGAKRTTLSGDDDLLQSDTRRVRQRFSLNFSTCRSWNQKLCGPFRCRLAPFAAAPAQGSRGCCCCGGGGWGEGGAGAVSTPQIKRPVGN